jgi:hypothetical protein
MVPLLLVNPNFGLLWVLLFALLLAANGIYILVKGRIAPRLRKLTFIKLLEPEPLLPWSSRLYFAALYLAVAMFLLLFVWQHRVSLIH